MSDTEITGLYILGMIESAGEVSPVFERKMRDILAENGLEAVDPEEYYSFDSFAASIQDAKEQVGENTIKEAGRQMIAIDDTIPEQSTIADGLDTFRAQNDAAYQPFEVEDVGTWEWERVSDSELHVAAVGGYRHPEALSKGLIQGIIAETVGSDKASFQTTETQPDEVQAFRIETN